MQIYTKWFLRLGLVIIAIPATSPLLAQSNDSRMLLEVQAMRQEIAELRDLVERQEYELSKLKRGLQTSTGSVPNAGQSSYGSNNNPVANNPVANNPLVLLMFMSVIRVKPLKCPVRIIPISQILFQAMVVKQAREVMKAALFFQMALFIEMVLFIGEALAVIKGALAVTKQVQVARMVLIL